MILIGRFYKFFCLAIFLAALIQITFSKKSYGSETPASSNTNEETKHNSEGEKVATNADGSEKTSEELKKSLEEVEKEERKRQKELVKKQPKTAIGWITELEKKSEIIEAKAREVEERQKRIDEQEKTLDKKLKEMETLRAAVTGELEAQRKNNEEKVSKMVTVLETMKPQAAAGVLETLDDYLSVEVLKRMESKKMAKVMNLMDKVRSAKLSELLTGFYRPENDRKLASAKNLTTGQEEQKKNAPAKAGSEVQANLKEKGGGK